MNDTQFFGKTIKGNLKACVLYVGIGLCTVVGGAFMSMDPTEWSEMWWMKKAGWSILLIGNALNTMKAFFSNSR